MVTFFIPLTISKSVFDPLQELIQVYQQLFHDDRAERHDFWPPLWLFSSPFLFPPKNRGKKKRRMNSKNLVLKSCLSARSFMISFTNSLQFTHFLDFQNICILISPPMTVISPKSWAHIAYHCMCICIKRMKIENALIC